MYLYWNLGALGWGNNSLKWLHCNMRSSEWGRLQVYLNLVRWWCLGIFPITLTSTHYNNSARWALQDEIFSHCSLSLNLATTNISNIEFYAAWSSHRTTHGCWLYIMGHLSGCKRRVPPDFRKFTHSLIQPQVLPIIIITVNEDEESIQFSLRDVMDLSKIISQKSRIFARTPKSARLCGLRSTLQWALDFYFYISWTRSQYIAERLLEDYTFHRLIHNVGGKILFFS